ncbi:MAG TPA: EamA family transporter [Patescibacteria group bacterium]|nr:EamA family transporter [Patescibacteria group bacterium]
MNWIVTALLTAFFFGAYNFFIKVASGHIHQILGAVILQLVATLTGALVLLYLRYTNVPLKFSEQGFIYAVLAGVFVGLAEITSFIVFSKGVSISTGIPIIIGVSVIFASLLGFLFLKEPIHLQGILGIILIIAGIVLLTR